MNLTVRIHDIEYTNAAQGVTFSEEYNETLDSGSIRLTHIKQIANLRPYDDVYIYQSAPEGYDGDWYGDNVVRWRSGGNLHNGDKGIPFYRHLLVDNYTESLVNISEGIMSYNIDLMSETKRLEMVQLPNICVTQPLRISKRHSIWWLMKKYVDTYSPKIKQPTYNGEWRYVRKFKVDPNLQKIFGSSYSQDFSLQNPTLRDVLSSLMITKDMIPYVKDDVIYAKDIGHTTGSFNMQAEKDSGRISTIAAQMTSADYCDGVRRQYSNAMASEGVCTFVEYLGFRNKDSALMSLGNIRLELGHPIIRIKKCNMCYYTKGFLYDAESEKLFGDAYVLTKHDITPLIKLKEEWSMLSQDWRVFSNNTWHEDYPTSMEDLAKYQLSTVYYSQGGTTIDGWGEKYSQTKTSAFKLTAWDIEKTRIENILDWIDANDTTGEVSADTYSDYVHGNGIGSFDASHDILTMPSSYKNMFDAQYDDPSIFNELSTAQKMKTIFFEIEYEGFYNGALIHSRDKGQDNIVQNDNSSGSLLLLEKDGTSQKAKINRFANKTYSIKGRLEGYYNSVQWLRDLGEYCSIGDDDNVIIYHREYSIYDNYILVSYACIQDYVLKNFYTSVYAKYRINQLMSYGESVNRSENEKVILALSKTKKYLNEKDTFFPDDLIADYFSAFKQMDAIKNINMAMVLPNNVEYDSGSQKAYLVDCNTFTSGNSLCISIAMPDNISGGTYVDSWSSDYQLLSANPSDDEDYVVGSEQQWNSIVDDEETGEIGLLNFQTGHLHVNDLLISADNRRVASIYNYLQKLPSLEQYQKIKSIMQITPYMSSCQQNKDNKERIDTTLQVEAISDTKDVVVSNKMIQLSDLILADTHKKNEKTQVLSKYVISNYDTVPFYVEEGAFEGNNNIYFEASGTPITDFFGTEEGKNSKDTKFSFIMQFDITIENYPSISKFSFLSNTIYWTTEKVGTVTHTAWVIEGKGVFDTESISKLVFWYNDKKDGIYNFPINGYYLNNIYKSDGIQIDDSAWIIPSGQAQIREAMFAIEYTPPVEQTATFYKNMYVQYSEDEISTSIVDEIIPYEESASPTGFVSNLVSDTFKIVNIEEVNNEPTLLVNITHINGAIARGEIKSINYWYLDFDSAYKKGYAGNDYLYEYTPEESGYKFVFGVNVSADDLKRTVVVDGKTYIPIYISKLTNRDTRMYDDCGVQVRTMRNVIEDTTAETGLKGNYIVISRSTKPVNGQILESYANNVLNGVTATSTISLSGIATLFADGKDDEAVEVTNFIAKATYVGDHSSQSMVTFSDGSTIKISQSGQGLAFNTDDNAKRVQFIVTQINVLIEAPVVTDFYVELDPDRETDAQGYSYYFLSAKVYNPNNFTVYVKTSVDVEQQLTKDIWDWVEIGAKSTKAINNYGLRLNAEEETAVVFTTQFMIPDTTIYSAIEKRTKVLVPRIANAPTIESLTYEKFYDADGTWQGRWDIDVNVTNPNEIDCNVACNLVIYYADEAYTTVSLNGTVEAGKTAKLESYVDLTTIGATRISARCTNKTYSDSTYTYKYMMGESGLLYDVDNAYITDIVVYDNQDDGDGRTYHQFGATIVNAYNKHLKAKNIKFIIDDGQAEYDGMTTTYNLYMHKSTDVSSVKIDGAFAGGYVKVMCDIYDDDLYMTTISKEVHP